MADDDDVLRGQDLLDALRAPGLEDWQGFPDGLRTRFGTRTFARGLRFLQQVGEVAEELGHHPDIGLTFPHVDVTVVSHDAGGVTSRDLELASRISAIARESGIGADRTAPVLLEIGLDTADHERIAPFWAALLTGDPAAVDGDDVVDPSGRMPILWFQRTDAHETPRQRYHLDVWVGEDQAEARIAAALAAGGVVVDAEQAPSFTVLADADGNRACVCTLATR